MEGCASGAPKDTRAEDESTIRACSATGSEAACMKDVEEVTSFYADDALAFSRSALRADLRIAVSATGMLSWKTSDVEVARSGDLAYEHGRSMYTTTEKDGNSKTQTGSYLLVWRKSPGGGWKIAVGTDTEDAPLAPLDPSKFRVRTCLCKRRGI